jgi:hypothetical protein
MNVCKKWFQVSLIVCVLAAAACSGDKDGSHTTATTFVSPPPRQVLLVETRAAVQKPANPKDLKVAVDPTKPLMVFNLAEGATFQRGEAVVIDFSLLNAKLKGDGGDFRVRYIIDDDEMKWIDRWEQVVLTGWLPGKHTIRLELVGPDGWPYLNNGYNVAVREITVQ